MMKMRQLVALAVLPLLMACGTATTPTGAPSGTAEPTSAPQTAATVGGATRTLRLATTTSTADSGLLDAILPDFETRYNANVDVVAVGTGQALKLGENGDADVVLVHSRSRENAFVEAGFGINRRDVMYNDFVLVGPAADPAGIRGTASAKEAFAKIAEAKATFAARGDDSGTATKELNIWASAGITPTAELGWYKSLGQGMGETLITANEQQAYTLTDRGTYLSIRDNLPDLVILLGGETIEQNADPSLRNPYGVIPVNPARYNSVDGELAEQFAEWITSPQTQQAIGSYGIAEFGQALFFPGVPQ